MFDIVAGSINTPRSDGWPTCGPKCSLSRCAQLVCFQNGYCCLFVDVSILEPNYCRSGDASGLKC